MGTCSSVAMGLSWSLGLTSSTSVPPTATSASRLLSCPSDPAQAPGLLQSMERLPLGEHAVPETLEPGQAEWAEEAAREEEAARAVK